MRNLIESVIDDDTYLDFWDTVEMLGIRKEAEDINDGALAWFNRNSPMAIYRLLKNPKNILLSKLKFYMKHYLKVDNYGVPVINMREFNNALNEPSILWRGGGGVYDPELPKTSWVAFTADARRATTFSEYAGTYGMKTYRLPKRSSWWVIETSIRLDEILLYLPEGQDEEVIIPKSIARTAKLIRTHEGDVA